LGLGLWLGLGSDASVRVIRLSDAFYAVFRLIYMERLELADRGAGGQRPRNLYGRDGKFRPTFKSGKEKRQFSVPFLMA